MNTEDFIDIVLVLWKETRYSIEFAKHLNYIDEERIKKVIGLIDELLK